MPDISAIAAALSALNGAKDIAQAMIGLRDGAAFQAKLIEFQSKLIDANSAAFAAQDERAALLKRIGQLEEEMAALKSWEAEKQRYKLTDFGGGTFAYLLKPEAAHGEPPHRICAHCYQKDQKSILQFKHRSEAQDYYKCQNCGEQVFGIYVAPRVNFYGDPVDDDGGDFMTR